MVTLHAYVLRELLKSFALAVPALAALFTMAGGLYDVLRFESVTTADLFTMLPMLLPVAVTITMPIAALLATTLTYGRLAADNEFLACRAAGINIHRLFLPAMLLAVFVALFTAFSLNALMPRLIKEVEYFARANIRDFAFQRLRRRGYVHYGRPGREQYLLTAERVLDVSPDALRRKGFPPPGRDLGYFWVQRPTILLIDKQGGLKRFSAADGALCQFERRGTEVFVTAYVNEARDYETGTAAGHGRIRQQKIGPYPAPIRFPVRPAMQDLTTLRRWRDAPWSAPDLARKLNAFLTRLRCQVLYAEASRLLGAGGRLVLTSDEGLRYELTAGSCRLRRREVELEDVVIQTGGARRPRRYEAPRARLSAETTMGDEVRIVVQLEGTAQEPVREFHPRAANPQTALTKETLTLDGLLLPDFVWRRTADWTPAAVLDPIFELPIDGELAEQREALWREADRLRRKIRGIVHFRPAAAASPLVTVLMGAALGVIFRGGRALSAFGLACVPLFTVVLLTTTGKQLTESASGQLIGPLVIWGGLALVAVADGVLLLRGVRR